MRFREIVSLTGETKARQVRRMFAQIARRYDLLNSLISLGQDRRWRRFAAEVAAVPPKGRVLDVASGTAELAIALASVSSEDWVVALDFCSPMMELGKAKVAALGYDERVCFVTGDALNLPFADDTFDAATIAFATRNVGDIYRSFAEMCRVIKPGARVVCLEMTRPESAFLSRLYHLYFHNVAPAMGQLFSRNREAYTYLPDSVDHFPKADVLSDIMRGVGLGKVWYYLLHFGTIAVHVGVK